MRWNRESKKKELWQQNTPVYRQMWINLKVAYRAFNRETKGMGLLFFMLVAAMIVINLLPMVLDTLWNTEKYEGALSEFCTEMDFYRENWRACEDADYRPETGSSSLPYENFLF